MTTEPLKLSMIIIYGIINAIVDEDGMVMEG